jgi:hypothetical protein
MPTSSTYAPGFVFCVARPLRRGLGCRSPRPRASSSKPTPASSASDRWAAMPGEVQHQHQHQHQTWHGDMVKAQERIHALHRVLGAFESYNVLLVWPQSLVPGIHPVGFAVPSCLLGHSSAFGAHLGTPALLHALSCVHFQICMVLFAGGWLVLLSLEGRQYSGLCPE